MSQKNPKRNKELILFIAVIILAFANVLIARQKLDESHAHESMKIEEWKRQNYISPADQVIIELIQEKGN